MMKNVHCAGTKQSEHCKTQKWGVAHWGPAEDKDLLQFFFENCRKQQS